MTARTPGDRIRRGRKYLDMVWTGEGNVLLEIRTEPEKGAGGMVKWIATDEWDCLTWCE